MTKILKAPTVSSPIPSISEGYIIIAHISGGRSVYNQTRSTLNSAQHLADLLYPASAGWNVLMYEYSNGCVVAFIARNTLGQYIETRCD
jgi:hypothetical protein